MQSVHVGILSPIHFFLPKQCIIRRRRFNSSAPQGLRASNLIAFSIGANPSGRSLSLGVTTVLFNRFMLIPETSTAGRRRLKPPATHGFPATKLLNSSIVGL
jgi:hypothetical protein